MADEWNSMMPLVRYISAAETEICKAGLAASLKAGGCKAGLTRCPAARRPPALCRKATGELPCAYWWAR